MKRKFLISLIIILIVSALFFAYYFYTTKQNSHLTLYGNIDIREVQISFRVFGKVNKLAYDEGDRVKTNTPIAELDKQPLQDAFEKAIADVAFQKVNYENSILIFERKKELLRGKFISEEAYFNALTAKDQAEASLSVAKANLAIAHTNLSDADLKSPANGTIISRVREPGTIVQPGETIYTLSLDDPVWARAYIDEPNLGLIYNGQKARVYTDTQPNKPYEGIIGFISPVAEFTPKPVETPELRTQLVYRLRVIIKNPDKSLRQGMPVTIVLDLQSQNASRY